MFVKAYAKINIGLQILDKRKDGYRNINSIFAPVCLFDELYFSPADKIKLSCSPDIGVTPEKNLVYLAAEAIRQKFPRKNLGAEIRLKKRIPIGAGLGGGSSDAAATVEALDKLWELGLTLEEKKELALRLGSDCPYFLEGGYAKVGGRGEKIERFDFFPRFFAVLALPKVSVSTKWAYESLKIPPDFSGEPADFKKILLEFRDSPFKWRDKIFNDFEPVVFEKYPVIEELKNALYENGADFALMSGSGSSVFGIFRDGLAAEKAAANLQNCESVVCEPM